MRSIWSIPLTPPTEKTAGKHPTQKPVELLMRIITACTDKGDTILDPFNGSGTTGVVAKKLGRNYIGIEKEQEYLDLTLKRLNEKNNKSYPATPDPLNHLTIKESSSSYIRKSRRKPRTKNISPQTKSSAVRSNKKRS